MSIATRAAAAVRSPPVLSRAARRLRTPQYNALMRRKYGKSNDNVWRLRCHKLASNIVALMHSTARRILIGSFGLAEPHKALGNSRHVSVEMVSPW